MTTPHLGFPGFELPAIAAPPSQAAARELAGLPYRAENLRLVEVFGSVALGVVRRAGHVHVSFDNLQWHWVDGSGKPIIIQGLPPGAHAVRIDLADWAHKVIDSGTVAFRIPARSAAAAAR